jgi:RNA recognition motif-containing protein
LAHDTSFRVTSVAARPAGVLSRRIFIWNLPSPFTAESLLKVFDSEVEIESLACITIASTTDLTASARICTFLPAIPFLDSPINVSCNSQDLPIVEVSHLNPQWTEQQLQQFFGQVFPVLSVNLVPPVSASAFQTAYLTLNSPAECDMLITLMNYGHIEGQEYLLSRFVCRDEQMKLARYELVISLIPEEEKVTELRRNFEKFGRVYQFRLVPDPRRRGSVLGYLTFFDHQSAYEVTLDRRWRAVFRSGVTIYVDNLQTGTTISEISELFSPQHLSQPPLTVDIPDSSRAPMRAILTFLTPEAAEVAAQYGNKQFIGQLKLTCRFPRVHDPYAIHGSGVILRQLYRNSTWQSIVDLAGTFGRLSDVVMSLDWKMAKITFCDVKVSLLAQKRLGRTMKAIIWYSRHCVLASRMYGIIPFEDSELYSQFPVS